MGIEEMKEVEKLVSMGLFIYLFKYIKKCISYPLIPAIYRYSKVVKFGALWTNLKITYIFEKARDGDF